MISTNNPAQKSRLLALKTRALATRKKLVAQLGPGGEMPLLSIRVVEGGGGPRHHFSPEGQSIWDEPERLYLARFLGPDGDAGPEYCVEEDDALTWAFALGWGEERC